MDTSFRISNTDLSVSLYYPSAEQESIPNKPVGKIISEAQVGGPAKEDGKATLVAVRWSGRGTAPSPHCHGCVPLFLYTKTICFSCRNEEQCLTDKGASSLLLCCL